MVFFKPWKFVGKRDYFYFLQILLWSAVHDLWFFSLFILWENFPADDIGVVASFKNLILKNFRRTMMLSAIEMGKFFDELVYILSAGSFYSPLT
jgi:hypothetical protein